MGRKLHQITHDSINHDQQLVSTLTELKPISSAWNCWIYKSADTIGANTKAYDNIIFKLNESMDILGENRAQTNDRRFKS